MDRIIFSQTSLSIRPSAALDFLSVATATPSKIRLADERIFCGVSPDIIWSAHNADTFTFSQIAYLNFKII